MKEIKDQYQAIAEPFRNQLLQEIGKRRFIRIHYFNELHEYISTAAIIKEIHSDGNGEFMHLSSGEAVRLDRIVRLDGQPAPGYDIQDFTCDC